MATDAHKDRICPLFFCKPKHLDLAMICGKSVKMKNVVSVKHFHTNQPEAFRPEICNRSSWSRQ